MVANVDPIFTLTPRVAFAQLAAANTGADLSSNAALIFTGAANGSLLFRAIAKYLPGTNMVASALRLWLNNGSTLSTTANNTLLSEVTMGAITSSQTAATSDYGFTLDGNGLWVPSGYKVYMTLGTWSTGTLMCSGFGGDF